MKFNKISLKTVKALKHDDILHQNVGKNADGTCIRWRVTGKVKLWKTRPEDFKVPIKHGMWNFWYLTPSNVEDFHFSDSCPFEK